MKDNKFFPEVKGNFGFGMMRLPMTGEKVDIPQTCEMVDAYLQAGFNYFDTAHGYIGGLSELAIGECIAKRHDRSEFVLADKLSKNYFNSLQEADQVFEEQLQHCGVEYFDFYLMHSQSSKTYDHFNSLGVYEHMMQKKKEGKIRHFGISFHDKPEYLEMILKAHPQIEFVQIQFNYRDYEDSMVCSKANYEMCQKYGKPCFIMEPVKGGFLANPGEEGIAVFGEGASAASYALRFAAGFENNAVVLSGMSTTQQMQDNLSTMKDFTPLNEEEKEKVEKVRQILVNSTMIPCTGCRYCTETCPMDIPIPDIFSIMNAKGQFAASWDYYLEKMYTDACKDKGKASDCIGCRSCEDICPQHIEISALIANAKEDFE